MTVFICLLRAVNVGGTGKLIMRELAALCSGLGFDNARTYIQSGNVVFSSPLSESETAHRLETALEAHMGHAPGVFVREKAALSAMLEACPYADKPGNQVSIFCFQQDFTPDAIRHLSAPDGEEVAIIGRNVHVYYPKGMGRSKLKLPGLTNGTARNLNTLRKLEVMATAIETGGPET